MSGRPAILGLVEKATGEGGSDREERRDTPSYKSGPKKSTKSVKRLIHQERMQQLKTLLVQQRLN